MTALVLTLLLFIGVNAVASVPALKASIVCGIGKAFGPVFGITSLVSAVVLLWALRNAPEVAIYQPPSFGRVANYFISGLAFLLFGIAVFRGKLRNILRFPLSIGVALLGIGHVLANGDLASLLFFAGLLVVAVLPVIFKKPEVLDVRQGHDMLSLLAGVALFGVMTQLHGALIGVNIVHLVK